MVAIRRYKAIEGDDAARHRTLFHRIPTAGDETFHKSLWGKPMQIVEAKIDKCCPQCGKSRKDGFDLGVENGEVFGARCPIESGGCGWSF